MGFKYSLNLQVDHRDGLPHAYLDMVSGNGRKAIKTHAADLATLHFNGTDSIDKIEKLQKIVDKLNSELNTKKSYYCGKRDITGELHYQSIIIIAYLERICSGFSPFDIILDGSAIEYYKILVLDEMLALNSPIEEIIKRTVWPFEKTAIDRVKASQGLADNAKAIFKALDLFSSIYLGQNLIETIYGNTIESSDVKYAEDYLYGSSALLGWDRYTDTVFMTHEPEYGGNLPLESLIKVTSSVIFLLISRKSGLSVRQTVRSMKNDGMRLIYDEKVSFAPLETTRSMKRILNAYNLIPDRYERLEDSLKTLQILIANI